MPKDPFPKDRTDIGAGTPLFDQGRVYPQSYCTDEKQRVQYARELLLRSDLVEFHAQHVRLLMINAKQGHWIQEGRWIGMVFRCGYFRIKGSIRSTREPAKARRLMVYELTERGQEERARLKGYS